MNVKVTVKDKVTFATLYQDSFTKCHYHGYSCLFSSPVIYSICEDFDLNFSAMFACTGLWNAFFLLIYVFFNTSKLMKYSSR